MASRLALAWVQSGKPVLTPLSPFVAWIAIKERCGDVRARSLVTRFRSILRCRDISVPEILWGGDAFLTRIQLRCSRCPSEKYKEHRRALKLLRKYIATPAGAEVIMPYLCRHCLTGAIADDVVENGLCPVCGQAVEKMCSRDHCHCSHPITEGIAYCPECGRAMCPVCGSHDVSQVSRVTGYLADVAGWNAGKRQELKDRTRVEVPSGDIVAPAVRS